MGKKVKIASVSFVVLVFSSLFIFFAVFYRAHLSYIEELQVFIPDWYHLSGYFSKPASIASVTGDFLTQFYYFPVAGAMVITFSLLLLWYVARESLKKLSAGEDHRIAALLPVVAGFAALCDLAWPLSNIFSIIFSLVIALVCTAPQSNRFRLALYTTFVPLLYIFAGSAFFIAVLFIFIYEISNGRKNITSVVLPPVIALITPFIFKDAYLLTYPQAYGYLSELKKGMFLTDYLPLIAMAAAVIMIGFLPQKTKAAPVFSIVLMPIIAVVAILAVSFKASGDIEKILRLDREALKGNWQKVLELSERYRIRNSLASYYTNIALSKTGSMPEELMHHYQPAATGLFIPVNADQNYLSITLSNEVHWHLGDVNASQHSALLGMIFSPRSQSSRLLKRLAEINIVNGEYEAARKFLHLLEKTWFHSGWAREIEKVIAGEKISEEASWLSEKRSVIPKHDLLRKTDDYVASLRMLSGSNSENMMAVNYLLCFHLLSKDLSAFADDFKKFWPGDQRRLPALYQEALLIRIASGSENREAYRGFIFSPEKIKNMAEYMRLYEAGNGGGNQLKPKFGETYWFYYHFARLKPE